jgi:hypothetical protein
MVMLADPVPYADRLAELGGKFDTEVAELRERASRAESDLVETELLLAEAHQDLAETTEELAQALRKPLNVRAVNVTADAATLEWDPVSPTEVYVTGRTGTDNRGSGVTAIVDSPTATNRVFIWLKPDTAYTLFVQAIPSGIGQAVTIRTTK